MDLFIQYSDSIIKPGLERIKIFLSKLGNPQNKFNTVLVGGTNGKGSTVSFLYHMLAVQGIRVGAYLSPHMFKLEERVLLSVPGVEDLPSVVGEMEKLATKWNIDLSPFELLTASTFVLFHNCGIDLAVLEVGMGGRWDATNITSPLVSIIASLGLDHTQYLGSSLASIAMEKLPIARKGRPLILGNISLEGLKVLREGGRSLGAELLEWGKEFFTLPRRDGSFCYIGDDLVSGVTLTMKGFHQWINASLALKALESLKLPITDEVLGELSKVRLPGRMQVEEVEGVTVVLDVAHNPLAFQALVEELHRRFVNRPLWAVLRLLRDKPWEEVLKIALEHFERIYFLEASYDDNRRVSMEFLTEESAVTPLALEKEGMRLLGEAKEAEAIVVFTGSFGAVKEALVWLDGRR